MLQLNLIRSIEFRTAVVCCLKWPNRRRLYYEKLGTSHDVEGFATGSFLEHIIVERANDDLC